MNGLGFLIIVVAFAFLWLVLVRPQKRRQAEQARMLEGLQVGDQVVTAGGIYGEITALRGDDVILEIAPELEVRVARRAIGGVVAREEDDDGEPDDTGEDSYEAEADEAEEAEQSPFAEPPGGGSGG